MGLRISESIDRISSFTSSELTIKEKDKEAYLLNFLQKNPSTEEIREEWNEDKIERFENYYGKGYISFYRESQ